MNNKYFALFYQKTIFVLWLYLTPLSLFCSCQILQQKQSRHDTLNLDQYLRIHQFNLLILYDPQLTNFFDLSLLNSWLYQFTQKLNKNFKTRIIFSSLYGNPPYYFFASDEKKLPDKFSSMFYQPDKFILADFNKKNNAKIPILKNIQTIFDKFTLQNFFIPQNDYLVVILSTQDDQDYEYNMDGVLKNDSLNKNINNLLSMNKNPQPNIPNVSKSLIYQYQQMQFFTFAPKSTCHPSVTVAERIFHATQQVNSFYQPHQPAVWATKQQVDFCQLKLEQFFQDTADAIGKRHDFDIKNK